jgi:tRNA nucleotidyltransferase (CCA-adding enzyme)
LAIPESQLEAWAAFVPSAISKATADSIRTTLKAMESVVRFQEFNVYLQGSYKNDTNLRGDSDVDVVVELTSTFTSNAWSLPPWSYPGLVDR